MQNRIFPFSFNPFAILCEAVILRACLVRDRSSRPRYGSSAGPPATTNREPGQARKGAATAVDSCAGMWLVELPPVLCNSQFYLALSVFAPCSACQCDAQVRHMARPSAYIEPSRHSVFYFRIRIPKSLRTSFARPDIRRSLETKCRREAVIRSAAMLEQVQDWGQALPFAPAPASHSKGKRQDLSTPLNPKSEVIHRRGPWQGGGAVEYATLD